MRSFPEHFLCPLNVISVQTDGYVNEAASLTDENESSIDLSNSKKKKKERKKKKHWAGAECPSHREGFIHIYTQGTEAGGM